MDLEEVTAALRQRVGDNSGLGASIKFDFGGDGVIHIDGLSTPNSVTNDDKDATCVISISMEDFRAMTKGELDPTTAFMMGRLKVDGDMSVAMKLSNLL